MVTANTQPTASHSADAIETGASGRASRRRRATRTRHVALAVGGLFAITITIAACSGSSGGVQDGNGPTGARTNAGNGGGPGGGSAASGLIAAVSGSTMQVQNQQTGQVAVTWTESTTFTQRVNTTASAINVGDCITAIDAASTASTTGSSATPANASTPTTVSISPAVNGECNTGLGGGNFGGGSNGGQRPSGLPSNFPSGENFPTRGNFPGGGQLPSGVPTGAGSAGAFPGGGGNVTSGKVTAVTGATIVVESRQIVFDRTPSGTAAPTASPSTTTRSVTLTLSASTTVTTEQNTTPSSVAVGKCTTVQGAADSSGAVTATSIALSDATNGQCTSGFGRAGGAR